MKSTLAATSLLAGLAAASPAPTRIEARATQICGQWDTVQTGTYTVYQDLWNKNAGTGSQCTTVDGVTSDNVISWSTSWSWSGGSNQVKSFANAVPKITKSVVSTISSIPSKWSWSYKGDNLVADVAYDLFTSSTPSGSQEYEIMIWLSAIGGAGPISSTGSPIATPTVAGSSWKLYSGKNNQMHVYSFVATTAINNFNGDLYDFISYLVKSQSFPSSQYLLSIGAGTEPFTGSNAVFTVPSFSCSLSAGSSSKAAASNVAALKETPAATPAASILSTEAATKSATTLSTATKAASTKASSATKAATSAAETHSATKAASKTFAFATSPAAKPTKAPCHKRRHN